MNKSEDEIASLGAYRKKKHLNSGQKGRTSQFLTADDEETSFQFFNYDPEIGQTDLKGVTLKQPDSRNEAVFSIPMKFTESAKTTYVHHDHSELVYDLRLYTTRNNAPNYPLRK